MTGSAQPWLESYPAGVPRQLSVPQELVPAVLAQSRRAHPDRTALWFMGRRIRFRTLRRDVRRFAAGLAAQGVGRGDRVSLVLPPSPQQVIAVLAVQRLGGVAVLHNPVAPPARLQQQMSQTASVGVVVVDHGYQKVKELREAAGLGFVVVTALADYQPPGRKAAARMLGLMQGDLSEEWMSAALPPDPQSLGFMDVVRTPRGAVKQARLPSSAPAAVVFSADPRTGEAVPVEMSHQVLVAAAASVAGWLGLESRSGERVVTVAPPFTAFGLLMTVLCLRLAATQVLVPRFEPVGVRAIVAESDATVLAAVPAAAQTLADIPYRDAALERMRMAVTGPEVLGPEEQRRVVQRLGVPLVQLSGPAECCGCALGVPVEAPGAVPEPKGPTPSRAPDGVDLGVPLPGVGARVVDRSGTQLPPGEPGLLQLRAPGSTGARRRWLDTDRTVVMDASGWFRERPPEPELLPAPGRIASGGMDVAPAEVSRRLRECPGVREAAVASVRHPYRGRALRAYVVPVAGEGPPLPSLYSALRKSLEPHMIPREILLVDRLPEGPAQGWQGRTLET